MIHRVVGPALAWTMLFLVLSGSATAADGFALLNRKHVGRVKAVDPGGRRLTVEGMFHDGSFREIPISLEPETAIIDPDIMNQTRPVEPREIRPGYYVALDCADSGRRHTARKVTITSTEEEEKLQRAFAKVRRSAPPGLRGTGSGPQ